jgi:hypothetical protein
VSHLPRDDSPDTRPGSPIKVRCPLSATVLVAGTGRQGNSKSRRQQQ